MISMDYIQKGILFNKPPHQPMHLVIPNLSTSLAHALHHFYPLAGRLVTTNHGDSISVALDCTDEGAEFVHASAPGVRVSDILAPHFIPPVVHSFFALNKLIGHDGHSHPLLGVQVTELADGIFVGCTINHTVADGTSFWHFFNTWSSICRAGSNNAIDNPPVFDRWFPDSCPVPIPLPYKDSREFIRRVQPSPVRECAFNFSSINIKLLKIQANGEMGCSSKISSLQALLAHAWRSVTRARKLEPQQPTTYVVYAGYRGRVSPPLPLAYLGNSILGTPATALAGEIEEKGLGWTAWLLNQAVASQCEARAVDWARSWAEKPTFMYFDQFKETDVLTGSSPRFDVYGNDFGWGRPVAVRSGRGSTMNGKMSVFPGAEEGSMTLEICLGAEALSALVEDAEFMAVVGC